MYEILPPGRNWPEEAEELAQRLIDGIAPDDRRRQAALSLLLRQPVDVWTSRVMGYYCLEELAGEMLGVDWMALASRLSESGIAWSDNVRAALALACSLADGRTVVLLGRCIADLSPENAEHLVDAVAHAAGVTR